MYTEIIDGCKFGEELLDLALNPIPQSCTIILLGEYHHPPHSYCKEGKLHLAQHQCNASQRRWDTIDCYWDLQPDCSGEPITCAGKGASA